MTNAQGAREVADKLVPSGSELESMWSNGAKVIPSGAIEALQRERKTDWGWADLCGCCRRKQAGNGRSRYDSAAGFRDRVGNVRI
jgi:Type IV secretion-system coupling protein DNA-binding domain